MKLTIENRAESVAAAQALIEFIVAGLKFSGYVYPQSGEHAWYTDQRATARQLQRFVEAATRPK